MKSLHSSFVWLFVLLLAVSCSNEFDQPPMKMPPAPNMTIAQFKVKHWQDAVNYVDTVSDYEVIHGWITGGDASSNISKALYIMDESGVGIPIAINSQDINKMYRNGTEVVLNMQGNYVGKLTGMMQIGAPFFYEKSGVWETSTMTEAAWRTLGEVNGFPDLSRLDTVEISLDEIIGKTDTVTQVRYQGLLVRINDVSFENGDGKTTYSDKNESAVNRKIIDSNGRKLNVRTSSYANFCDSILPKENVDLVGLMGYFATKNNPQDPWQLYLRDINDVIVRPPRPVTWSDFETMGEHTSNIGTFTSELGWVAVNCLLLEGGEKEANPIFPFIGKAWGKADLYAKAPTLNGGTDAVGVLTSPVLHGGMKHLYFSYGYAFSGKQLACRIDVKQDGQVVKTWTLSDDNVITKTAYTFDMDCQIEGDFTIEFTNLCPSGQVGKKDRLSIWNVHWDMM